VGQISGPDSGRFLWPGKTLPGAIFRGFSRAVGANFFHPEGVRLAVRFSVHMPAPSACGQLCVPVRFPDHRDWAEP